MKTVEKLHQLRAHDYRQTEIDLKTKMTHIKKIHRLKC